MQFKTLFAAVALPVAVVYAHAAPAPTTASTSSLYEAPRPSGVPGNSFGFTASSVYGGYVGATNGAAGGQIGGTVNPAATAASGAISGAYSGASGMAGGHAAPTAGSGAIEGSDGGDNGVLSASYGSGGISGCGGGAVNGQGTTLCLRRRDANPTA